MLYYAISSKGKVKAVTFGEKVKISRKKNDGKCA
jgi:hypothetical protein